MLSRRMTVAIGWVTLAIINLGVYEYTQFVPSAVLSAVTAGIGVAMLIQQLRELL